MLKPESSELPIEQSERMRVFELVKQEAGDYVQSQQGDDYYFTPEEIAEIAMQFTDGMLGSRGLGKVNIPLDLVQPERNLDMTKALIQATILQLNKKFTTQGYPGSISMYIPSYGSAGNKEIAINFSSNKDQVKIL